jgi:hypothetical protein
MTGSLSRPRAIAHCAFAALAALVSMALVSAAALAPAPPAILPFAVLVGILMPMGAALDLPAAIGVLRRDARLIAAFRRHLARLPDARHPLDR